MRITLLTPTADRPVAFALCEKMMARQSSKFDEWIVADGGEVPALCTMGQTHVHMPQPPGAANFAGNLSNGLARATGDAIIFIEDDDWYAPEHVATLAAVLERRPIAGAEAVQRYYNVARRCWLTYKNVGASLCQTAIRRELSPKLVETINACAARNSYGIDTNFWRSTARDQWGIAGRMTVVGIKGLPGRAGLGVGHRPSEAWNRDPDLRVLREWIGEVDAAVYAGFALNS
jgi:glycosyltransferase involved in cell wall biosynthesis